MKNTHLITALLATATLAALPSIASADHRSKVDVNRLGEVDTHANDVEDFVTVAPAQHYDSIVIVARDGVVPLSGLKIQYADGRIVQPMKRGITLQPGQRVTVDVPSDEPIKMLVLDYDERKSSRWGDRANARVEVLGQRVAHVRYRGARYDRIPIERIEPRDRDQLYFTWTAGAYVRVK